MDIILLCAQEKHVKKAFLIITKQKKVRWGTLLYSFFHLPGDLISARKIAKGIEWRKPNDVKEEEKRKTSSFFPINFA